MLIKINKHLQIFRNQTNFIIYGLYPTWKLTETDSWGKSVSSGERSKGTGIKKKVEKRWSSSGDQRCLTAQNLQHNQQVLDVLGTLVMMTGFFFFFFTAVVFNFILNVFFFFKRRGTRAVRSPPTRVRHAENYFLKSRYFIIVRTTLFVNVLNGFVFK